MEIQQEIENESRIYGKRTFARSLKPQMKSILSWKEGKDNYYDYKKNKSAIKNMSDFGRYKNLIDKTKSIYVSEYNDNYNKFNYLNKQESLKKFPQHYQKEEEVQPTKNPQSLKFQYEHMSPEQLQEYLKENEIKRSGDYSKAIQKLHKIEHTMPNPKDTIAIKEILQKQNLAKSGYFENGKKNELKNSELSNENEAILENHQQTNSQIVDKENSIVNTSKKQASNRGKQKRMNDRIKKFKQQTRWLPNSAFQTYFGKPAFENYGRGNTNPVWGGPIYGNYLKTHNINPQRGQNKPKYEQVYTSSQLATAKINYNKNHICKAPKEEYRLNQKEIEEQKNRLKLTVKEEEVKKLGKLIKVNLKETKVFKTPRRKKTQSVGRLFLTKKLEKQKKQKKISSNKRFPGKIVDKKIKGFEIKEHFELNPQNYLNLNPQYLNRIPYAGKKSSKEQTETLKICQFISNQLNLQKEYSKLLSQFENYETRKFKSFIKFIINEQKQNKRIY